MRQVWRAGIGGTHVFGACVLIALLALFIPSSLAMQITAGMRRSVLRPIVAMNERGVLNSTSRFRLAAIQKSHDSLALLVQSGTSARRENDNLRSLFGLRQRVAQKYVASEILHRALPTDARTLLIGVGADDGVRALDPVVTADGLIGYVWTVGPKASTVYTWAHPEFRASAVTEDGRVVGIVQASPAPEGRHPMLQLTGVALRDSLAMGTRVVSAGLGGVFPRGIPIGRVTAVGEDEFGYERIYRVAPSVNPGSASHVLVLISPRDTVFLRVAGDSTP